MGGFFVSSLLILHNFSSLDNSKNIFKYNYLTSFLITILIFITLSLIS
jgi:hypothetical protein